jgi:hypothetical protein
MKFVIHHHRTEDIHFDFMIDNGKELETWQITEDRMEQFIRGEEIPAKLIPPHRREYLEYEGPVSKGRGRVEIYDRGECRIISRKGSFLSFMLKGKKFIGKIEIKKTAGKSCKIIFKKTDE